MSTPPSERAAWTARLAQFTPHVAPLPRRGRRSAPSLPNTMIARPSVHKGQLVGFEEDLGEFLPRVQSPGLRVTAEVLLGVPFHDAIVGHVRPRFHFDDGRPFE